MEWDMNNAEKRVDYVDRISGQVWGYITFYGDSWSSYVRREAEDELESYDQHDGVSAAMRAVERYHNR